MRGEPQNLLAILDRTPVTWAVLASYLLLGVLTDPFQPTSAALVEHGAAAGILIQDGEPWRLVTAAFLHGGILHLGLNAYALYWIGPQIEERLGSLRFALLYVVTAVGGNVVAVLTMEPDRLLVGGSGALFGMFGAAVALLSRQGRSQLDFLDWQHGRQLLGLIAANLAIGLFIPLISNAAHVGGLISGFLLTFLFLERGRSGADAISRAAQAGWIALFVGLVLYTCFPVLRWDYQLRLSHAAFAAGDRAAAESWAYAFAEQRKPLIKFNGFWGQRGKDIQRRWMK